MPDSTDIPALVAKVREMDAKATPGPWTAGRPDLLFYRGDGTGPYKNVYWDDPDADEHFGQQLKGEVCEVTTNRCVNDSQLVALYRTAAPVLAEEVERLQGELAMLHRVLDRHLDARSTGESYTAVGIAETMKESGREGNC